MKARVKQLEAEQNQAEARRIRNHCLAYVNGVCHPVKNRVESKVAKEFLKLEWSFCQGDIYDHKSKSIGCGLYDVWVVKRK